MSKHSLAQNPNPVPLEKTFLFTMLWFVPLALLLLNAVLRIRVLEYSLYSAVRYSVVIAMLCFAVAGLLRAFDLIGDNKGKPWFTDALLISLVLFWGLFPPIWFFTEYLSFDRGSIALPLETVQQIEAAKPDDRAAVWANAMSSFLSSTKTYADMSAKVWAAVGTVLAGIIALVKRPA